MLSSLSRTDNANSTISIYSPTSARADNQSTSNIIFGAFAIVLGVITILLAWLQLRRFRRSRPDEATAIEQQQYEFADV
jgi:hypothetical protein